MSKKCEMRLPGCTGVSASLNYDPTDGTEVVGDPKISMEMCLNCFQLMTENNVVQNTPNPNEKIPTLERSNGRLHRNLGNGRGKT